jgi:hypothetical protein
MAQANKGEIVLGYWAIRGLAEPIRLALHYAKKPYTEKMYEQGEGPEFNGDSWLSEKQKLGLGKLRFILILQSIILCSLNFRFPKSTVFDL